MSGHSKWSTIKRKKGAQDAKRSAAFNKLTRLIEVAARNGADPEMNFKLKLAVQKAKEANMPNSNIEKAVKKGSGQDKDTSLIEEVTYEGFAPGNVAVVVEALTDNKNRTVSELRNLFNKSGATFGSPVMWQFENQGILQVAKGKNPEADELAIIDAGAEELEDLGDSFEVHTKPKDLALVKSQLEKTGLKINSAELEMVAKNKTTISDVNIAKKILNFLEVIEDQDDVVNVYSTLDVPDAILDKLS